MNLIDVLIQSKVPLWLVIAISVFGVLLHRFFIYQLEKAKENSVKELEHTLEKRKIEFEKKLEIAQERHNQKVEAADKLSAQIAHFDHSVTHLRVGHYHDIYLDSLEKNYSEARRLAREYESILGIDLYNAALKITNLGICIREESMIITQDTIDQITTKQVDKSIIQIVSEWQNKPIPVSERKKFAKKFNKNQDWAYPMIYDYCAKSPKFDGEIYYKAKENFRKMVNDLIREPLVSQDSG